MGDVYPHPNFKSTVEVMKRLTGTLTLSAANFAPGVDSITLTLALDPPPQDAGKLLTDAKLQVFRNGNDKKPLDERRLTSDEVKALAAGTFTFDGSSTNKRFPDGFITVDYSPYKLRIASGRLSAPADASVAVLASLVVDVADPNALQSIYVDDGIPDLLRNPNDDANKPATSLAAGGNFKVVVDANRYAWDQSEECQGAVDLLKADNSKGPRIALVATLNVKDVNGNDVPAGKARGKARVLWSCQDALTPYAYPAPPDFSAQAPGYIGKVESYKSDTDQGHNAHVDFGGKRGSGDANAILEPPSSADNLPYTAAAGKKRTLGMFSDFIVGDDGSAKAGVIFKPSVIGGDAYNLAALLSTAGADLDSSGDIPTSPAPPSSKACTFVTWRQINITRVIYKGDQETQGANFDLPPVNWYFSPAYLIVKNDAGEKLALGGDDFGNIFNKALPNAIAATQQSVDTAILQHALYDDQWAPDGFPKSSLGFAKTLAEFTSAVTSCKSHQHPTMAQMQINSEKDYENALDMPVAGFLAIEIARALVADPTYGPPGGKGMTIVQFQGGTQFYAAKFDGKDTVGGGAVGGVASFIPQSANPNRLLGAFALSWYVTPTKNAFNDGPLRSFAHELGHCLGLPHSADAKPGVPLADGVASYHDGSDQNCLMSYNPPTPSFCGKCILRLRGYNRDKV